MRCTGPPCKKGPHCQRDPISKRHYPLNTQHLKSLIMYVRDGHTLQTYDDVPKDICEELYAEEQQSYERHKNSASTSTESQPLININVLPAPSCQKSHLVSCPAKTLALGMPPNYTPIDRLNIPDFRDDAVKEYCAWQESQVKDLEEKREYQTACDVILGEGMDLELIRRSPNSKFLIDKGVKRGPAEWVVNDDINFWVENIKRPRTKE